MNENSKDNNRPEGYFENDRVEMLMYVPEGVKTCLEFGCGTGGFSAILKDRFSTENWAVELDTTSAEKAALKLDKVLNKDAVSALSDLPENYFDCVILLDVLEHISEHISFLDTLKTKLKKGGVLIASIPNVRYYRNLVDLVIKGTWDYTEHGILDKSHLRFFTRKSIIRIFEQLNYKIHRLEGMHPTSSRTFKLLNLLSLASLRDARYKHFAVVAEQNLQKQDST